ncbi:MAG: hypothetical protein IKB25_04040 [Lentisphaeria bacterium]|nr:hypothetical protein [Lentisphaeria bacterium]
MHNVFCAKLATRQHHSPRMVIGAYCGGKFEGNILNLTEPDYSSAFVPVQLENSRFPADWQERTSHCTATSCAHCHYCDEVYEKIAVKSKYED